MMSETVSSMVLDVTRARRTCHCGKFKNPGKLFCPRCTAMLPREVRAGVDLTDTSSALVVFKECCEWLEAHGYLRAATTNRIFEG
jgi:hypothetical protein